MSQTEHKLTDYTFDIITNDEKDYRNTLISKKGPYEVQFTIAEVEKNQNELSKMKREAEGKKDVESAVMANVEHFHPFVKDLTDEQLHTVWMYYKAKRSVKAASETVGECEKELVRLHTEKEHILNVLGFVKTETPVEPSEPLPPVE